MKFALLNLTLILSGNLGYAEQFDYQKGMVVELGESWNPGSPFAIGALNSCIEYSIDEKEPIATEKYSESFADNFHEFKKATSLSFTATGSGSYGLSKVNASASYQDIREIFKDNKSVVYVVTGKRSYNPVRLSQAKLSPEAKSILSDAITHNDSQNFYQKCGEAIITSVSKETNISLAYIFTASNSSLKKKIKAAISAAVSSTGQKASVESNIMSAVSEVDSSVTLQVEVLQAGTIDTTDSLKSIVGIEPGDITQVREALRTAINSISWTSSQISSFTADKMSRFFNLPQQPDWKYVAKAFSKLDKVRKMSDSIVTRYLQLEDVLNDADQSLIKLKPGMMDRIEDELFDLEDKLENLVSIAKQCFETKTVNCRIPRMKINSKILHLMDVEYGNFSKWQHLLTSAKYDSHTELVKSAAQFWPEFLIQNTRYLRSISLIRNNQVEVFLDSERISESVSNGKLDLKPHFNLSYSSNSYCWRGEWGQKCEPWARNGNRLINSLKSQGVDQFKLLLVDIEGNTTFLSAPPLKEATF